MHDYLAMNLNFTVTEAVKIDTVKYVKEMLDDATEEVATTSCLWNSNLFNVDHISQKLSKEKAEQFHAFVIKEMFLGKRADKVFYQGLHS